MRVEILNVMIAISGYKMKSKCKKHYPVSELSKFIKSSIIGPGRLGFDYFNFDKWFCANCNKPLKAKWSIE